MLFFSLADIYFDKLAQQKINHIFLLDFEHLIIIVNCHIGMYRLE